MQASDNCRYAVIFHYQHYLDCFDGLPTVNISRRSFLKNTLASTCLLLPPTYCTASTNKPLPTTKRRILVVIQLLGGNDGLNTVIPYSCGHYYDSRPTLSIPASDVLPIDSNFGLHSSMTGLAELHKQGVLAIMLGVGCPQLSRSHFRSSDIWQTADPNKISATGWLGRYLAEVELTTKTKSHHPLAIHLDELQPKSLAGAAAVARLGPSEIQRLLRRLKQPLEQSPGSFSQKLSLVGQMIVAGYETQVYFLTLSGFDTHADQQPLHATLLRELSAGLLSFHLNLRQHGLASNVLTITFSEFGRRLAENLERGSDHGTAAVNFIIGESVRGGLYGQYPSFNDLSQGDLKPTMDFRTIYATILERWLNCDSRSILGEQFELHSFV